MRIRATVDGRKGRTGPLREFGSRQTGRCDRKLAGRDPHQRQEGRSATPESSSAVRQEGRAGVLNEDHGSTEHRHVNPLLPDRRRSGQAAGRCGRTFCTSIKAALNGPHAPPPGRVPAAAAVALRPSRLMPGGWRGERGARGRRRRIGWGSGGGLSPAAGRAAPERRGVGHTPGPCGGSRWRLGGGYRASGGGAWAPGWPGLRGRVAVGGWLRGAIPPADDPGEPSRPPPDPPASDRASRPS